VIIIFQPVSHSSFKEDGSPVANSRSRKTIIILATLLALAAAGLTGLGIWVYRLREHKEENSSLYADIADMIDSTRDASVDPCDDFYAYACNSWIKANPIPDDVNKYSRSFNVIGARNTDILHTTAKGQWPVIGPFYDACMNTALIDKAGFAPIQALLEYAGNINFLTDAMDTAGYLVSRGVNLFFDTGVEIDAKNPSVNMIALRQGGLSYPTSDFYFGPDNHTEAFLTHMTKMFELIGESAEEAAAQATLVNDFETAIAKFTIDPTDMRDPESVYNKVNLTQLLKVSNLPYEAFFGAASLPFSPLTANLDAPSFFANLAALLTTTEVATLRAYAKWHIVNAWAPYLSSPFADEHFRFWNMEVYGQKEQTARWKMCTELTDSNLGDILGRYFVQQAFNGDSQDIIKSMIQDIERAFGANLPNVDWMDDQTREAARKKLALVVDLVGAPVNWTDYSSVNVQRDAFFANLVALSQFQWKVQLEVLQNPVDKYRWQMTPATVNAYYEPTLNTINFPAGILQPTFFNASYPSAMNFGGIGMVMGHELTHGFDDQGRMYDGTGKLTNWWTKASTTNFEERAACLINQYNGFVINDDGDHVNGNLTLGENIADNGGIRSAYFAWKAYIKEHGDDAPVPTSPKLTNDQLFFLAFAQGWCANVRPAYAKVAIKQDVHSPPFARVLGPLQNFDKFAEAFHCKAGSKMNPVKKCVLW